MKVSQLPQSIHIGAPSCTRMAVGAPPPDAAVVLTSQCIVGSPLPQGPRYRSEDGSCGPAGDGGDGGPGGVGDGLTGLGGGTGGPLHLTSYTPTAQLPPHIWLAFPLQGFVQQPPWCEGVHLTAPAMILSPQ